MLRALITDRCCKYIKKYHPTELTIVIGREDKNLIDTHYEHKSPDDFVKDGYVGTYEGYVVEVGEFDYGFYIK